MRKFHCKKQTAYLITDRLTRNYLCGKDVAEGYLIVHSDGATLLTDARYFYSAKTLMQSVGVDAILYQGQQTILDCIKNLGIKTLYIDYTRTTVCELKDYKKFGVRILDCSKKLQLKRTVKDKVELKNITTACKIVEKAYYSALKTVEVGISEKQLQKTVEDYILQYGADGIGFETIVAFGSNASVPHHVSGDTKLKDGMSILIDTGANYRGYISDLTRTAFFGQPDQEFIRCYNAVLKANQTAEQNIIAGMTAKDADGIARGVLSEYGLDKFFTHSLGHGVGLEVHEYPTLSMRSQAKLKNRMVFTIEPGVYKDGELGIRIEDTVVLINGKVKRLFTDDKQLITIKK